MAFPPFPTGTREGTHRLLSHKICSSWVSHYPEDFPQKMSRIAATGMNALELEQNVQLSDFAPKNLNTDPTLPYEDESFDVVTCVVSVDYLTKPLEVFKEVNRVLKPGGKLFALLSYLRSHNRGRASTLSVRNLSPPTPGGPDTPLFFRGCLWALDPSAARTGIRLV